MGPDTFFDRVEEAFWIASSGELSRGVFRCGASCFTLLASDLRLYSILARPFAHVRCDDDSPAWTVMAFSGGILPPPEWTVDDYGPQGAIKGFNDDHFCTIHDGLTQSLYLFHPEKNKAIYWIPSIERIPEYEQAAPFRHFFQAYFRGQNSVVIHGAVIGKNGRGLLLPGAGGSGKTTAALLAAKAGFDYLSDDYAVIDKSGQAFSLYQSAKVSAFTAEMLKPWKIEYSGAEKMAIYLHEHIPERLAHTVQISAVVTPKVVNERPSRRFSESASQALLALAPSTMLQFISMRKEHLAIMADCIRSRPVFRLELGRDLNTIPRYLEDILN